MRSGNEQIGGMDEQFFMYSEEVDWCYRARRAGWAIWQVPEARVTHAGGAATSQFRTRMLVALYESRLRFFRKHYSPRFVRWHIRIVRAGMLRAALLVWRAYLSGRLGREELRARLLDAVDPLPSRKGKVLTGGRINAARAVGAK